MQISSRPSEDRATSGHRSLSSTHLNAGEGSGGRSPSHSFNFCVDVEKMNRICEPQNEPRSLLPSLYRPLYYCYYNHNLSIVIVIIL